MFLLLRYVGQGLARNKGRSLAALSGAFLAVALIAGANLSVDATSKTLLLTALDNTPVDTVIFSYDLQEIPYYLDHLQLVDGLETAEPVVVTGATVALGDNTSYEQRGIPILGLDPDFANISERLGFTPGLDFRLADDEMLVNSALARWLEGKGKRLRLGDAVDLEFYEKPEEGGKPRLEKVSLRIKGIYEVDFDPWANLGLYQCHQLTSGIIVNRAQALAFSEKYGGFSAGELINPIPVSTTTPEGFVHSEFFRLSASSVMYLIRIDRGILRSLDPDGAEKAFEVRIEDMKNTLSGKNAVFHSPVDKSIIQYSELLENSRAIFLLASLPLVALGVYLAMIGMDLGLGSRRNEIILLKARGASGRQVTNILFTESVVLGAAAGAIGLGIGSLLTWAIMLPVPAKPDLSTSLFQAQNVVVSSATFMTCLLIGIVIMLLASIRPIRRMNRVSIVEATAKYSPSYEGEEYKRTTDILLVLLAVFIYVSVLASVEQTHGGTVLLGFVLFFLGTIGALLLPFSPVILIMGLTRLLTRGTTRTYEAVSRILKPMAGSMCLLIARNLSRHPRRTSRVAVLIALSLAFGILVMVFSSTMKKEEEMKLLFQMGSDLKITEIPTSLSESNLTLIEGVEAVCTVGNLFAEGIRIYAIDPERYAKCVEENRYFTNDLKSLLARLAKRPDGALCFLSGPFGEAQAGQRVMTSMGARGERKMLAFSIIGGFEYAPGIEPTLYKTSRLLLVDRRYVEKELAGTGVGRGTILIRTSPETNRTRLKEQILKEFPELSKSDILVADEEVKRYEEDRMTRAIYSYMDLEFGFTLLMATFGLGLIMYMAAAERGREVAAQRARGASKKQVLSVLAGEGFSIVVLAFLIGVPVGFVTVWITRAAMMKGSSLTIHLPLVIPPVLLVLFGLAALSLAFASMVSAAKVSRIRLGDALRMR